jgi:nicotinamidase-related amidase
MSETRGTHLSIPEFAGVNLLSKRTALLVLDCTASGLPRKSFADSIPILRRIIDKARKANLTIIYTFTRRLGPEIVEEIKPDMNKDYLIETAGANKFYNTRLENLLFSKDVTNVVLVGTAANGAVMYTAFDAMLRGFTVAIPADGISAENDEIYRFTLWQLVNAPGRSNPQNKPMMPLATTLTSEKDLSFY